MSLYLKLIIRGLLRHRKAGKRLFILLGVCSTAVLFCLAFRDSFVNRFQQLAIDTTTAHLQILPVDSPKVHEMAFADQREGLTLLDYSRDLELFLQSLPSVAHVMPAIETTAAIFTIEGEPTSFAPSLIGVDVRDFSLTLPGVSVLEGERDLTWREGMTDIPVFRPPLEFWEIIKDNDRFTRKNFRLTDRAWEEFKTRVARDMPALLPGSQEGISDQAFLSIMNSALERTDLPGLLPAREGYDFQLDDALAALSAASQRTEGGLTATPRMSFQLKVLRKRLLQSVYPEAIPPVRDTINLNISYTMAVPSAKGDDPLARPAVLPVRIAAYVQRVPMFFYTYYIDARVLRDRLGLGDTEGTSIYIRLKSNADTSAAKKSIEQWLAAKGKDYLVRDYTEMGQLFLSTAAGFRVVTLILIVLFMATVTIFIVNTVLLSLIKRRREIGTAIAMGLSPRANVGILLGEMLVLVCVSWALGSVLGIGIILLLHRIGIPGIIFMPDGRLPLDFSPSQLAISFVVFFSSSALAALIPLLRLVKISPVDLLKEAS